MTKRFFKAILIFIGVTALFITWTGCSSDNKKAESLFNQNNENSGKDTSAIAIRVKNIKDIFNDLPSTIQIMQLLKKSGSQYIIEIPSDPTTSAKYSSKEGQALNLGIYAADLAYAGLFDQKTDASLFLETAHKLSSTLGIPGAFNENIVSRIEANMAEQDSLLTIILNDFWTTDTYLKKNDRQEVSAYLVSGGWVEGLYIATQLAAKTNSADMANEIARQKMSLQNLTEMLKTYPNSPNMQNLTAQLKKIEDVFSGVQVDANSKEDGPALLTADQLKAITDAISALRAQLIQQT